MDISRATRLDGSADQIDLGKYAAIVARRWKLVAAATIVILIAAAVATLVLVQTQTRYQAETTILLTGPRYKLNFDPKISNVDSSAATVATRTDEYKVIASSPDVMAAVIRTLQGKTAESDINASKIDVRVRGQLISVNVTNPDPAVAASVADAYATAVAERLDAVYGQADQDREALQKQLADSVQAANDAEAQLRDFMQTTRIDQLLLEINQKEALRQQLSDSQNTVVKSRLASYYSALSEADKLLRAEQTLRQQLQSADQAPATRIGAGLALLDLQSRVINLGNQETVAQSPAAVQTSIDKDGKIVTSPPDPAPTVASLRSETVSIPNSLQIQLNADSLVGAPPDAQKLQSDTDLLITNTQARRDEFQQAITQLLQQVSQSGQPGLTSSYGTVDQPANAMLTRLAGDINVLRADLSQETFRRDVLNQNLDLAKTTRTTLETKLREASISAEAGAGRAIVASPAQVPAGRSFPPSLSRTLPLAAIAGIMIGVILAILADWIQQQRRSRAVVGPARPLDQTGETSLLPTGSTS